MKAFPAAVFFLAFLAGAPCWAAENPPVLQENTETTIEDYLQSLSTVQNVVTRKDPFLTVGAPFQAPTPEATVVTIDEELPVMSAPVLERYRMSAYEVVAVLLGDKYPRALVRLPASEGSTRKVVIVREGDKLGNREGVITKITTAGVAVTYPHRSRKGVVTKVENLLQVGGTADAQKAEFAANVPAEPPPKSRK